MEKIIVEMKWEVPNKCTPAQRNQLRSMIDIFMNDVAEKFAWNEEIFSIENNPKERKMK